MFDKAIEYSFVIAIALFCVFAVACSVYNNVMWLIRRRKSVKRKEGRI